MKVELKTSMTIELEKEEIEQLLSDLMYINEKYRFLIKQGGLIGIHKLSSLIFENCSVKGE